MPDVSILQQINNLMEEKEAVYRKREEQLQEYHSRLKEFEKQLTEKVKELQEKKKELEEREKELQRKQNELETYEKNMQESIDMLLSEKMKLESRNKEQLEDIQRKEEENLRDEWENSELEKLGASLGIALPSILEKDESEKGNFEEAELTTYGEKIPELFQEMEKVVKKKYAKWDVIEILPERFCVQVGDKEIRVFHRQPIPLVQIVMYKRAAKTDKKIQTKIVAICRIEPEWSITCEENNIICSMAFQKETEVELVLEKCNQFMKNHLKF